MSSQQPDQLEPEERIPHTHLSGESVGDISQQSNSSTESTGNNDFSEQVDASASNLELNVEFIGNNREVPVLDITDDQLPEIDKQLTKIVEIEGAQTQIAESSEYDLENQLIRDLATNEKELELLKVAQTELHAQQEMLDEEIEEYLGVLEDLDQWVEERKRSYAWRLLDTLKVKRTQLEEDEKTLRDFSREKIELDRDFAPKTRRWILKSILWNWGLSTLFIFIVLYIRRNRDSILDSLSETSNNQVISNIQNFLRELIAGMNYLQVLSIIIAISSFLFIGTLFSYSRKVSAHSRQIEVEANRARIMSNAVFEVKQSRIRIDALHPQLPQLLEVLSMVLHAPLVVDSKYLEFSGQVPDTREIPESLEFASPTEESIDRVFETLVLKTLNEIQRVGWRDEWLRKTTQELGETVGIGLDGQSLSEIESDQRRNGKRQLLLSLNDEIKNRALTKIGDELIPKLAEIVQERVLPSSPPNVKSLRPDPLMDLQLSESIGEDIDLQVSTWEEKLIEAAGKGSPWSVINFSNEGQSRGKHLESIESIFIASKQICENASKGIKSHAEIEPGTRPFEVSIRVDLSSWCRPGDLAIFEGLESSEHIQMDEHETQINESKEDTFVVY